MLVLPVLALGYAASLTRPVVSSVSSSRVVMSASPSDPQLDTDVLAHRIASHRKMSEMGSVFVPVLRAMGREGLFSVRGAGSDREYVVAFETEDEAGLACLLINAQREEIFDDESEAATVEYVPAVDVWQYVQSTVQRRRDEGTPSGDVTLAVVRSGELRDAMNDEWLGRLLWDGKGASIDDEASRAAASDDALLATGCTDTLAVNFSSYAMVDDGTCVYG